MEIIGERINGMFKDIREGIKNLDKKPIQHWAIKQTENGAAWLDINTGASAQNPLEAMKWMITAVQEVVQTPLCLDSTNYDIIEEGLKLCKVPAMINSCHADRYKIERVFPMAIKYNAKVIGLAMTEDSGIPKNCDARVAIAMELVAAADEYGLPMEDLYIDPLVMPVNCAQDHAIEVMETLKQIKLLAEPSPKTVVGLSNCSQGTHNRGILNRTLLTMLMAYGLDSAIADADDKDLMEAAATARIFMNKEIYCESYIDLYKNRNK